MRRSRSRCNDVPQADPALTQSFEPRLVCQTLKIVADRAAEEPPELVGRMCIILPRRERGIARQTAEHEKPSIRAGDRGQTDFDAHSETPTARTGEIERPPDRPLFGQL